MENTVSEGSRYASSDDEDDSGLERDIELLHERICEFEIYLMQMDAVVGTLQKERDKMDEENIELQKENERFHQEIKFEKIHNADLKNELKKTRRNRVRLRNEQGLSIFGWENKWAKMEKKKKRLEEENEEIEEEVNRLKKYIAEQQKDLVSQKHTNLELLNQLTECVDVNNRKIMVLEEIWKKVEDYTNILEDHFDELKCQERQKRASFPRHGEASMIEARCGQQDNDGTQEDNVNRAKRLKRQQNTFGSEDIAEVTNRDETAGLGIRKDHTGSSTAYTADQAYEQSFVVYSGCFLILAILATILYIINL